MLLADAVCLAMLPIRRLFGHTDNQVNSGVGWCLQP